MAEERRGSHDSVELVYGIARAAYPSSPRDTELQILGNTVGVIHRNERSLQRADSVFGLAVLLLFLGTLLIGARVAMLLL